MQPAQAFAPNATTFLTHLVGGGLADTRYVVERFKSMPRWNTGACFSTRASYSARRKLSRERGCKLLFPLRYGIESTRRQGHAHHRCGYGAGGASARRCTRRAGLRRSTADLWRRASGVLASEAEGRTDSTIVSVGVRGREPSAHASGIR